MYKTTPYNNKFLLILLFISILLLSFLFSKTTCAKTTQDSGIWISNTYQTDFGGSK